MVVSPIRRPATSWYHVVAVLFLLWELVGVAGFVFEQTMSPVQIARMTPYDRHLYFARPGWATLSYAIATLAALAGGVALLMRRRIARALFIVSLVFVAVLFGWALGATDLIAVKGFATAAGLPIVVAVIGAVQIGFAGIAIRRGWIG